MKTRVNVDLPSLAQARANPLSRGVSWHDWYFSLPDTALIGLPEPTKKPEVEKPKFKGRAA